MDRRFAEPKTVPCPSQKHNSMELGFSDSVAKLCIR
jgi:hypothetical protein